METKHECVLIYIWLFSLQMLINDKASNHLFLYNLLTYSACDS